MSGRALVTGANGFVGAVLCRHLESQGWQVCEAVHRLPAEPHQRACDIRHQDQVEDMLAWAGPVTHVFHLAGIAFVPEANRHPARAFDVNLTGTAHLALAMGSLAPGARLVFAGSSGVYGPPQRLPITEAHAFAPQSVYDISKAAADQFLAHRHRTAKLDVVRMRAFNHSGPGQSDDFVLSSFARQVAQIEAGLSDPVIRVGNLNARRDFLHVADVVRAYELAALRGHSGAAYNVCSGQSHSIQAALDLLLGLSRTPIRVEVDETRLRASDVEEVVGSYERLKTDTDWQPVIPFDDMVRELLDDWRARVAKASAT